MDRAGLAVPVTRALGFGKRVEQRMIRLAVPAKEAPGAHAVQQASAVARLHPDDRREFIEAGVAGLADGQPQAGRSRLDLTDQEGLAPRVPGRPPPGPAAEERESIGST